MAPHMLRDYHSTGDPGRYSLRATKHSENILPRLPHVDTSKINGKEDFFLCMGLQKRFHHKSSINDSCRVETMIPAGVMLRDCSVVILGEKCKICGRLYKCKTDINVHMQQKHYAYSTEETQCKEYNDEIYSSISSPHTVKKKSAKKLQITFKIGWQVLSKRSVKRKHLKRNAIDTGTQTELYNSEIITDKDGYESSVPHIDPPSFCTSPSRCSNPTLHEVNTDRYVDSNIVTGQAFTDGENMASEKNLDLHKSNNFTQTFTISSYSISNKEFDLMQPCLSTTLNSKEKSDTDIITTDEHGKQRDINANEISTDISVESLQNSIRATMENSVIPEHHLATQCQSAPPQQPTTQLHSTSPKELPIHHRRLIFSQQLSPSQLSSRGRRQSIPLEQSPPNRQSVLSRQLSLPELTPSQQQPSPQQPSTPLQQQTTSPVNQQPDDEIQEVLRIVRGRSSSKDINQESPNRYEQLLLHDVIEDMRKMEERGLHLLEKKFMKIRKRILKNGDNEPVKKKKKAPKSNDKHKIKDSKKKKLSTKAQKQNSVVGDVLKENLTCNGNVNSMDEMLRGYGINFYNDTFEVNNNTENIQEPVRHFLAPCSDSTENRGNRPIVIDLVNDTDE
ncbi:uncharacterized protein LOC105663696 [Megachile rotundata]|uniref:uncharacterized protein LOC105663696 n=1 Tax=Megachile rotundata TaxID=143995 RepID=UPI003FD18F41